MATSEYGTSYLVNALNRLGNAASYQHLDKFRRNTIEEAKQRSPFDDFAGRAFVTLGIDNINIPSGHSSSIHERTYSRYDGLAMQGVNYNTSFNYASYYCERHPSDNLPKFEKKATIIRESFMEETVPALDDKDTLAYTHSVLGLAVVNRSEISGRDTSTQFSIRRVVMDSLQGFS